MDKLKAIRFFLKVSETLSFKQTALHFAVPSSTVSRSIKSLEEQLGATLLERTTRQVRPTETGQWYREEIAGPLRALDSTNAMVDSSAQEPAGTVRITALPEYGKLRLFSALDRFRHMHPEILCDLELTGHSLDLSSGEIDVALRVTAEPPEYLVARRLHTHRSSLFASPAYLSQHGIPASINDMAHHAALAHRGAAGICPWKAALHAGGVITVRRRPVLIANDGLLLLDAALAGEGIAFLPEWGVKSELEAGRLVRLELNDGKLIAPGGQERSMYLLYAPEKARLGKIRALVDFLVKELSGD